MKLFVRMGVAAAAAVLLAAAAPIGTAQAESGGDAGAIHFFPVRSQEATGARHSHSAATGDVEYFGGTVFSTVDVVSVMWGPNVNGTTVAEIPDFSAALVNSTFMQQLGNQYSTVGVKPVGHHKSSDQTIGLGVFYGQVQITPKHRSTTITNKDVWKEIQYQISIGVLPPQTPNMLYMIYFPQNVTITAFGLTSCQDFGAYHFASSKKQSASNIFYAVEPDCNAGFDYITFAASHEFAEATTDNIPTPGSNPKFPQAWNTSDGYEIGDLCEGYDGELTDQTRSYEVTQVWLNTTNACSTGNYQSPP